jgi:hypothetical protein
VSREERIDADKTTQSALIQASSTGGLVGTGTGAGMAVVVEILVVVAVTVIGGFSS